jgi:predicted dehydrogenase
MITRPLFGQNAPSNKLNVALIGVWGRGLAHYDSIAEENVVALCDINEARFPDALKRFPVPRLTSTGASAWITKTSTPS